MKLSPKIKVNVNPCIPQDYLPTVSGSTVETEESKYIIGVELKDVYIKTGDGEDDFTMEQKFVEISRVNRQEYIDSFKDDVGILNIMRKVEQTGDVTLLNQRVRSEVPVDETGKEKVVDISNIGDQEGVINTLTNVSKILQTMDPSLRDAILNMNGEELKEFLANRNKTPEDKKDGE